MTPTIEAAKLIKRAANGLAYDIADMKHSQFKQCILDIDQALNLLNYCRPRDVVIEHNDEQILQIADNLFQGWRKKTRLAKYRIPRHCVMYMLRKYAFKSLTEIGMLCTSGFHKYDHTSVLHAVRSVENAIETQDNLYLNYLNSIKQELFKKDATTKTDTTNQVAAVN